MKLDDKTIFVPVEFEKEALFFEQEVYDLFSDYLPEDEDISSKPRVVIDAQKRSVNIFDFILPTGCKALNTDQETYIECRARIFANTIWAVDRLFSKYSARIPKAFFVMVYDDRKGTFIEYNDENDHIKFIGFTRLEKKLKETYGAKKEGKKPERKEKNIEGKVVHKVPNKKEDANAKSPSWRERTEKNMGKLKLMLDAEICTPILGAGVSIGAGVPSWTSLLIQMLDKAKEYNNIDDAKIHYNYLNDKYDGSLLVIARIIENYIDDPVTRITTMADILYAGQPEPHDLIKELANLIKKKDIKDVITFNYDTLLEDAIDPKGDKVMSIFRNAHAGKDCVSVYHVHGMIKNNATHKEDNIERAKNEETNPVLSENEYHGLYGNSNSWSNVRILNALYHTTCILVGLSMTDPNLRRLLDISKNVTIDRETGKKTVTEFPHYVLLGRIPGRNDDYYQTQEDLMNDLGLNVIWYEVEEKNTEVVGKIREDHSDLARKIHELTEPFVFEEPTPLEAEVS